MADVPDGIRTENLPNTTIERYPYSRKLRAWVEVKGKSYLYAHEISNDINIDTLEEQTEGSSHLLHIYAG